MVDIAGRQAFLFAGDFRSCFSLGGVGKDPLKGAALLASISVFSEHG